MITIDFTGNINNDSLQIGDLAYYITPSLSGGFNTSIDASTGEYVAPTLIGKIEAITLNSIDVDNAATGEEPAADDFIMFAKDSRINLSGLVGYYAEVKIKNNSTEKAEMYSIASEITPSSK
tara:strand:- start:625 stop:990 length:366 start_codon:yes stop_codon:yes gene_type:complete